MGSSSSCGCHNGQVLTLGSWFSFLETGKLLHYFIPSEATPGVGDLLRQRTQQNRTEDEVKDVDVLAELSDRSSLPS